MSFYLSFIDWERKGEKKTEKGGREKKKVLKYEHFHFPCCFSGALLFDSVLKIFFKATSHGKPQKYKSRTFRSESQVLSNTDNEIYMKKRSQPVLYFTQGLFFFLLSLKVRNSKKKKKSKIWIHSVLDFYWVRFCLFQQSCRNEYI